MLRQLAGEISVRHCSSEVRNTRSRLFRPVQGPHTVSLHVLVKISDLPIMAFAQMLEN